MIEDDVLVFDCVAHPFNFDASNALGNAGELFRQHLYAFHNVLTPEAEPKLPAEEFLKEWSTQEISRMVSDEPDTDMLVAMPLPLADLFQDGLSPWERCVELRDGNPDRTVFWGTVNPLEGRKALEQMEIQVNEFGAKAFKFYNVRYDYGEPFPWRMDDPQVAFPIYEKAQKLGVNLIGVHKGVPLGPQPIEATQTWDMDGAAANFPDINFVIFHVGLPFIDETCWQLVRHPNLYASIAATIDFVARSSRQFAEWIGKLMFWCGEDKIIYGSETPIWHPKWMLDAFWEFEIPQDMVEGYGYPQLTERAKRKILGENLLRLSGMDVDETRSWLAGAAREKASSSSKNTRNLIPDGSRGGKVETRLIEAPAPGASRDYKMLIGGEWVEALSGKTFESINPYTGRAWATAPEAGEEDVDRAVRAARAAFDEGPWGTMTGTEMARLMRRLAELLAENAQELAVVESTDNGKLLREMGGQLGALEEWYYYFAGAADKIQGETIPSDKANFFVYTRREPIGVVGAIAPWNSPLPRRRRGPSSWATR